MKEMEANCLEIGSQLYPARVLGGTICTQMEGVSIVANGSAVRTFITSTKRCTFVLGAVTAYANSKQTPSRPACACSAALPVLVSSATGESNSSIAVQSCHEADSYILDQRASEDHAMVDDDVGPENKGKGGKRFSLAQATILKESLGELQRQSSDSVEQPESSPKLLPHLSRNRRSSQSRRGSVLSPNSIAQNESPAGRKGSDVTIAWQGGRTMRRRSSVEIAPIGDSNNTWGKYDSLLEIMSRPSPAPPVQPGQNKTLAMHGGRWSLYRPVTDLYLASRRSMQTPGPGHYGHPTPDAVLSNCPPPFGKLQHGEFMKGERTTDVDTCVKRSKKLPGPGEYDTEHLFGMYQRIRTAIPDTPPRPHTRISYSPSSTQSRALSDSYTVGGRSTMEWGEGSVGTASALDSIATEQCLVMSMKVPAEKHQRLGVTCFSRLRKDRVPSAVRKVHHRSPTRTPSPYARIPKPALDNDGDVDSDDVGVEGTTRRGGGAGQKIRQFSRAGREGVLI